jgi:DNA processing protein
MTDQLAYIVALHTIPGLGAIRLKSLLDYFGEPQKAWLASSKEWQQIGIPKNTLVSRSQIQLDPLKYLDQILQSEIRVLSIYDTEYPALLKEIYDPPVVLYYKGDWTKPLSQPCVGIVGTRKISGYGRVVTETFSKALAEAGVTVVSGLARGVDGVAQQTAVNTAGQTIAVLGGGLNKIYPAENVRLAQQIVQDHGVLVSEFPPDYDSVPGNFPARNRIISGLSKGVLVTEAAIISGSLITAKEALEQGREVFAVPGPITTEGSSGTNLLLKNGAHLVTDPQDILDILNINPKASRKESKPIVVSADEQQILDQLSIEQRHIDELVRSCHLNPSSAAATLIRLEIKGLVKNIGGGSYIKL